MTKRKSMLDEAIELEAEEKGDPIASARVRKERDQARREAARLSERVEELERTLGFTETAMDSSLNRPKWLAAPKGKTGQHRATLLLMLSDTHFDEVVNPAEMHDLNAYNREIATLRLKAWAQNSVKVGRHYLAGVNFDGVVLMLGGDIFSGDIHEELAETNEDTSLGSLLYWAEQLGAAIDLLADEFGAVHIPVVPGNHGRTTRKPRMKMRAKTNLDWLLAKMIEREFAKDKRVSFQIGETADQHIEIYNFGHHLTHGDQARGGSGIGGIYPPIMRMRARKAQRAMTVGQPFHTLHLGHFHTYLASPHLVANGTTKGYDEYALLNSFEYGPPCQALSVVAPEHNITMQAPIFCMDRKAEGW